MGGWWGEYSFRCQPVDHSASASATRVSSLLSCETRQWPIRVQQTIAACMGHCSILVL